MFKRVLLCYDGSEVGRRALKRGAELAILVGAQVYVLSIVPSGVATAAVAAGAAGHACLVDEEGEVKAGDYVWRPKGSTHTARAPEGALVLGIFLRPNRFV